MSTKWVCLTELICSTMKGIPKDNHWRRVNVLAVALFGPGLATMLNNAMIPWRVTKVRLYKGERGTITYAPSSPSPITNEVYHWWDSHMVQVERQNTTLWSYSPTTTNKAINLKKMREVLDTVNWYHGDGAHHSLSVI